MDIREIISSNIRMLIATKGWSERELSRRSNVPPRTINTITNMKSYASAGVLSDIAAPFGLKAWHLLVPNLPADENLRARIDALLSLYASAAPETQGFVDYVLRHGKLTP